MIDTDSEVMKRVGLAALAAFGGLVGYTVRQQERKEAFSWSGALVQTAGSGFVGLMVAMLCAAMGIDGLWVGPIVGIFGWMGATATIDIVRRIPMMKLGITPEKGNDE